MRIQGVMEQDGGYFFPEAGEGGTHIVLGSALELAGINPGETEVELIAGPGLVAIVPVDPNQRTHPAKIASNGGQVTIDLLPQQLDLPVAGNDFMVTPLGCGCLLVRSVPRPQEPTPPE